MKIRIVDIAKKAGVSVGTVDRIIHQRGRYSEEAAEKVQKAIKELGYEPDLMARNLALKKELRIVCLLPNPDDTPYWERPYRGIEKAIRELMSFKVVVDRVVFSPRLDDFKKVSQQLLAEKPDGVVYVPMFFEESVSFANQLTALEIPFVHINIHQPEVKPLSFVGQDPIAAGKVAASLCKLSLKPDAQILISYVSKVSQDYSHHQDRIEGFKQYFQAFGDAAPTIHELHLKIQSGEANHEHQLLQHLQLYPQTQMIYVPNSRAYQIAAILQKHNKKHIMVIGFDTLLENVAFLKEGFVDILIGQQSQTQGYQSVMQLFNALFRKEEVASTYYLPIDILTPENIDFYERGADKHQH